MQAKCNVCGRPATYRGTLLDSLFGRADGMMLCEECWQAKQRREAELAQRAQLDCVKRFQEKLVGSTLSSRYEWTQAVRPVLFDIDQRLSVEASVVVLLSDANRVVGTMVNTGTATSVPFSIHDIIQAARKAGATKIVTGHSHPVVYAWTGSILRGTAHYAEFMPSATPSDADVECAAGLYWAARDIGLDLVDDLVVCRTPDGAELKSVMSTLRFKRMVREY